MVVVVVVVAVVLLLVDDGGGRVSRCQDMSRAFQTVRYYLRSP